MIAVVVPIHSVEAFECQSGQVLCGRNTVEDDCLVFGEAAQKVYDRLIAGVGEESVIPFIDQMLLGSLS